MTEDHGLSSCVQVFAHYKALAAQAETDTAYVSSLLKGAATMLPELGLPRTIDDLCGVRYLNLVGDRKAPAAQLTKLLQEQLYANAELLVTTYQVGLLPCCSTPAV